MQGAGTPPSAAQMGNMTMGPAPTDPRRLEVTHIEIRRLQNGFLMQAITAEYFHRMEQPQRLSYVAKDAQELGTLIEALLNAKDVGWLPSNDIPVHELIRRPDINIQEQITDAVRQGILSTMQAPQIMRDEMMGDQAILGQGRTFGGVLNTAKGPTLKR